MAKKIQQTEADKNLMYALIVLVLVIVLFITLRTGAKNYGTAPRPQNQVSESRYPAIDNSSDLDKASAELDSHDLNAIDKELNSLDTDATSL